MASFLRSGFLALFQEDEVMPTTAAHARFLLLPGCYRHRPACCFAFLQHISIGAFHLPPSLLPSDCNQDVNFLGNLRDAFLGIYASTGLSEPPAPPAAWQQFLEHFTILFSRAFGD